MNTAGGHQRVTLDVCAVAWEIGVIGAVCDLIGCVGSGRRDWNRACSFGVFVNSQCRLSELVGRHREGCGVG